LHKGSETFNVLAMTGQPPIYVINMQSDKARWHSVSQQIAALGLVCERVEAVDGRLLSVEQRKAVYADWWFCLFHGRRASGGEIGCALSHRKIYKMMIERGQGWAIILEDDVFLDVAFAAGLAAFESETRDFDVVQFYAFCKPRLLHHASSDGQRRVMTFAGPHGSTAAYGLRLSGARKLLAQPKIKVAADKWSWLAAMTGLACCGIDPFPVRLDDALSGVSTISAGPASQRTKNPLWLFTVLPLLRLVRFGMLWARGV
jgi:glycosyl transferase, family 25